MSIVSVVMKSLPVASVLVLAMLLVQQPVTAQGARPAAAGKATAAAALGGKTAGGSLGVGAQAAACPVIGVVDVIEALEKYPRYAKMRGESDQLYKAYQEQLAAASVRLNELRGTIEVLDEGAPERADAEFQYKLALQTQDFQRKAFNDRMQTAELRNILSVYEDLDFAIAKVARLKGIALVLPKRDIVPSKEAVADLPVRNVQARVASYERRKVWFASKELDITGDVIKFMLVPLPDRNSPERAAAAPKQPASKRPAPKRQAPERQGK